MEELRACLFCGRYIDKSFRYCPHCGYEFAQKDEYRDSAEDAYDVSDLDGISRTQAGGRAGQAVLSAEGYSPAQAESVMKYLSQLQEMERTLCDIEKELDLIILRGRGELPVKGPVTSSSKGP
jgi:hypothetical protein